jgi:replication factor C subunit 2/4
MESKGKNIWVEKYRPSNIDSVIQQEEIKQLISTKQNIANLPHLLLYGPPGTGKTTTALAICKKIFASNNKYADKYNDIINERVLNLNASDERGIKIVREKIKIFASQALNNYDQIPHFKIIILDEADAMSNDAQFALRRIIEQYSHITRFILICNYVTRIIAPLSSRCSKYRFNPIKLESMQTIVQNILTNEKIFWNESIITNITKSLYNYSGGDLRKAITLLQRTVYISNINDEHLSSELVDETAGQVPRDMLINLYDSLKTKQDDYLAISANINHILNNGYSADNILNDLSIYILNDPTLSDTNKSKIFIKMSDVSNLLSNGSGDYIQLLNLCSFINYNV